MDERETHPLIKLIEENCDELVRRMIEVNTPAPLRESMELAEMATAVSNMNRVLNSVVNWLGDRAVQQEGMLVVIDYTLATDGQTAPEAAMKRIDRTMQVIADFAGERFGSGRELIRAERQMQSAATLARLVVAGEALKRTNQREAGSAHNHASETGEARRLL